MDRLHSETCYHDTLVLQLWAATSVPISIIKNLLSNVNTYCSALEFLHMLESAKTKLTFRQREQLNGDITERDHALKDILGECVALKFCTQIPKISQEMADYLLN
jgi:hypothetical protein